MEQNVHKFTECEPSREVPGTEVTEPLLFQILHYNWFNFATTFLCLLTWDSESLTMRSETLISGSFFKIQVSEGPYHAPSNAKLYIRFVETPNTEKPWTFTIQRIPIPVPPDTLMMTSKNKPSECQMRTAREGLLRWPAKGYCGGPQRVKEGGFLTLIARYCGKAKCIKK